MTHLQKDSRNTHKDLVGKRAENSLRMKVLRYVLAVGFVLSPWLGGEAHAAGNITYVGTNQPNLIGSDGKAHIFAQDVDSTGKVGLNHFQTFNVVDGEVANLYFQQANGGAALNSLVNTVAGQINISGVVNGIRNGKIGGNLYFLTTSGMVVGSTGVINAGSLTVAVPENLNSVQTADKAAKAIPQSNWGTPYARDGKITVNGTINTATGIDLQAVTVEIKAADSSIRPTLLTGVVFEGTVNTSFVAKSINVDRLSVYRDTEGKIILDNDSDAIVADPSNVQDDDRLEGKGKINIYSQKDMGSNEIAGTATFSEAVLDAIGNVAMDCGSTIEIDKPTSGTTTSSTVNKTSITSGNQIKLVTQTGDFYNAGTIIGTNKIDVSAGNQRNVSNDANIINYGTIQSTNGGMSLAMDRSLTNTGAILAKEQIAFTVGGNLTNEGKIESTSSNVQAHIGRNFKNLGDADSKGLQKGFIQAGGNVQVDYNLDTEHTYIGVATPETGEKPTIDGIYNSGLIWAKGDKDPVKKPDGTVDANSGSGNIWLTSAYNIENTATGQMIANRQITLNARDFLHNYGLIQGVTYLDIKSIMGYVYNHGFEEDGTEMAQPGRIIATGGNIDLSTGQADLQIDTDLDGTKKKLYRKFTPIIIEGKVEATSALNNTTSETNQGNINIRAYLGDIYVNGGTIETKAGPRGEVESVAGNVTLDAAQNITIGFETESARADDPTTDAKNDSERGYYKPKVDTSGKFVNGTAANISGTNITLTSGSRATNTISISAVNNALTASDTITINTDSMNIVGGTFNAANVTANGALTLTGGIINAANVTANGALTLTGGTVGRTDSALTISGAKGLTIGSDAGISTGGNLTITSSNDTVTNNKALEVTNGSVSMNGNGGVKNNASITAKENVSMTSEAGSIDNSSSVTADNGSVSMNAGRDVTGGTITGKDVTLTGGSGSNVTADSITVDNSLQLQGDNITATNVERCNDASGALNVGVSGAGGSNSTALGKVDINISGNVVFGNVNVSNANVKTSGTMKVEKLHVENNAQFTSNDTTVNVYGQGVTPAPDAPNTIQDKGDGNTSWLTLTIDKTGVQSTFVGEEAKAPNNIQDSAVQLSGKLVDYNPYDTYLEHYGDVADLFGRSDLIQASERPTGETATREEDNKVVLKQDADGLRLEEQKQE